MLSRNLRLGLFATNMASTEPGPSTSTTTPASEAPKTTSTPLTKLIVSGKQRNNPVLKYVRAVPYEWSDSIRPDYICGRNCGLLYLTLKWHKLHPAYLETRCNDLTAFEIKILLVVNNVEDPSFLLRDLNIFCYRSNWTMIVTQSVEEAGEYIENVKLSERRNPAAAIRAISEYRQKRMNLGKAPTMQDKQRQLYDSAIKFLSSVKTITATDAKRLLGWFGSIAMIAKASVDQINRCPGLGLVKSQRLHEFFRAQLILSTAKPKKK